MLLWKAHFKDGHVIEQPEDDRYSKHDDSKSYNPSAFRDILEYPSEVTYFELGDWRVNLVDGLFENVNIVDLEVEPLTDRKLIYYRTMEMTWTGTTMGEPKLLQYVIGYEGKNNKGKVEKKVMRIVP